MEPSTTPPAIDTRYQQAQAVLQSAFTKKAAFNTTLYPHWIGDSDYFWYARDLSENQEEYRLVNAATADNTLAFDHQALATSLASQSNQPVDPSALPITDIELSLSPLTVRFVAFDQVWQFDAKTQSCQALDTHPKDWVCSPDGNKAVFSRGHNLWLHDIASGEETPLTHDGEAHYVYGGTATAYGRQEAVTLEVCWSPDSKRLLTVIKDNRDVKVGPALVAHVPQGDDVRPTLVDPDRRVAYAGDEHIEGYRVLSIELDSGQHTHADYALCPVFTPPYVGFFTGARGWWSADNQRAYFIDLERGDRTARLIEFDTHSGKTRTLIEETACLNQDPDQATRFTFIPRTHLHAMLTPLPESNEVIWYSERSGWAHLYLYDLETGELKNTITSGEWLVRHVLQVDAERRELTIQTAGREAERNPYYCDIARVNIDTGEMTTVVSSDHEYLVCDPKSRANMGRNQSIGVSPSANYIVTTRSRVDQAPVSVLLDRQGDPVLTLETANTTGLPDNWQWPEPVMLKAADGETDIYAVVFRPTHFSPDISYPVIDCSWGSFLPPVGSFTNNMTGNRFFFEAAALAELGFITVMLTQRGMGEGMRSKAFTHDKEYWNCISPNQADCVAGIQQLAQRYPYMDLNRVGTGPFPSTNSAVAGMLRFPDFYKVGVACNAYSDNRVAAEFYAVAHSTNVPAVGEAAGDHPFHALANNLQGKLLLIHGMMNPCTPVAATFGLVEALHLANKDFDLLLLPNLGHSTNGYTIRRSWNYFVEHLLGEVPPKDFALKTGVDLIIEAMNEKAGKS